VQPASSGGAGDAAGQGQQGAAQGLGDHQLVVCRRSRNSPLVGP
jgi:hypothetical protein